ncbi:P2X purinoceptor 4, partial [Orchesella cincta]
MFSYFKDLVISSKSFIVASCITLRQVGLCVINFLFQSLNLDIRKVYQSECPVRGVVLSKVKGFASTENLTDEELAVENSHLYRRTWDQADIVYPEYGGEGETGSFTIVTNLIITPNQTLSSCAEEFRSSSKCLKDSDCQKGYWSPSTHGVYSGKCVHQNGSCEINGWCPIERGVLPRKGLKPLLEDVQDFTIMLKNTVEFPDCGNQQGRNLPHNITASYLKDCMYHKETDPLCPIFRIGDIIKWSGDEFSRVAVKGGVFRIKILWECDFDFGRSVDTCKPKYDFIRVDDREAGVSTGWNFRSANYYSETERTLKKQFALKILINLEGEGRKFNFFQLVVTLGATIGLFSVAPLVCDFLVDIFHMLDKKIKCGKAFYDFENEISPRFEDQSPPTNPPSSTNKNGLALQGVTNKAMCSS